jgi:hypothetical protein
MDVNVILNYQLDIEPHTCFFWGKTFAGSLRRSCSETIQPCSEGNRPFRVAAHLALMGRTGRKHLSSITASKAGFHHRFERHLAKSSGAMWTIIISDYSDHYLAWSARPS